MGCSEYSIAAALSKASNTYRDVVLVGLDTIVLGGGVPLAATFSIIAVISIEWIVSNASNAEKLKERESRRIFSANPSFVQCC